MDCPVCKEALVVMELSDVEVDHCLGCRGIWLDAGELEVLLEPDDMPGPQEAESARRRRDEFLGAFKIDNGVKERRRKCPICRRKMDKAAGGRNGDIVTDRCVRGHGLWFDDGELRALVESANSDANADSYGRMVKLLRDMFKN